MESLITEPGCMPLVCLSRLRNTLNAPVTIVGQGLFSGETVTIRLIPTSDTGIIFRRIDLKNSEDVLASIENVVKTPRCTILGKGECSVQTVEHFLAALSIAGIDDLIVEIDGPEVPDLDGASLSFLQAIESVGVKKQKTTINIPFLSKPVYFSQDDVSIIALPSQTYRISYTLHYPQNACIGTQFYSSEINYKLFRNEIAPCRTFSLYEEILMMMEKGMLKGGNLENSVVIKDQHVLNPEGLKFANEPARHKVLDMVGDLSLAPPFIGHVIAIRSGHAANHAFGKLIQRELLNLGE